MHTLGKCHLPLKYSQYWHGKQQTLQQHTARQPSSSAETVKHTTPVWNCRIDLKVSGRNPARPQQAHWGEPRLSRESAGLFAACRLQPSQFFNSHAGGHPQQAQHLLVETHGASWGILPHRACLLSPWVFWVQVPSLRLSQLPLCGAAYLGAV